MPSPYPQFVYDFTAARGIAKQLDPVAAKTVLTHLEGQVSGEHHLASDIVKEIYFLHGDILSLPDLPVTTLDDAMRNLPINAARGLAAALTRDKPVLSAAADTLLKSTSKVHGIGHLDANEARDALLVCSVIYTLPRMTAAVSTVAEHVVENWIDLSASTQDELYSIISEAIATGRAGADFDRLCWMAVLNNAETLAASAQHNL